MSEIRISVSIYLTDDLLAMTSSAGDSKTLFEKYSLHFGLGAVAAIALGVMTFQFSVSAEDGERTHDHKIAPPPMPTTGVEAVENEVIGQVEIDYDAELKLSSIANSR